MADSSVLRLKQISPEDEQSLVFSFGSVAGDFRWTFQPGSMAEFLALMLGGALRPGRGVALPKAAISVKARGQIGGAELCLSLGPVDLIAALDPADLDALALAIARAQATSGKG